MTVDWLNVDTWFGAFIAPCAKEWACSLVYPFFVCVCAKPCSLVCSVFVLWMESGQDMVLKTMKFMMMKCEGVL